MKLSARLFSALILVGCQLLGPKNALLAQTNGSGPAWLIKQTCGVLGDHTIYLSKDSILIRDLTTGIVTSARAPDWTVTTVDSRSKTYSQCPLDGFKGYIPDRELVDPGMRWNEIPLVEGKPSKVAGLDAKIYVTPPTFTDKQTKDLEQESASLTFAKSARFCISQTIPVPKQAIQVLSRFYRLPEKEGIPLQFKYHTLAGHMTTWLFTTSLQPTSISSPPTAAPLDFKKLATAADVRNVLYGEEAQRKMKKKRPLL